MRVLVCDDDQDSAEALGTLLAVSSPVHVIVDLGFDGRQAVDIARNTRPDVVILDLEMPVLNGFDAAAAIRATLSPPPMLVAVSGAPAAVIAAEAGSVFDHALRKPLDFDDLCRLLFKQ